MAGLFNVILIETHNACTRACWFCKFGQKRQDAAASKMDWPTIERIVGNLRDLDYAGRISWFWINEPLMDARMPEILSYTRRQCPRAFLSLVTNGDLLTDALYRDLRRSGLGALGVSIYDNRAAERVGRLCDDDRLVLIDMRKARPGRLDNRGGNIKPERLFHAAQQKVLDLGCDRPFNMMTINARGQVVLCCSDLYSDLVMGDAASERLEHIWNNERFRQYRSHLAERGRRGLRLCEACSYRGNASTTHYPLPAAPSPEFDRRVGAEGGHSGSANARPRLDPQMPPAAGGARQSRRSAAIIFAKPRCSSGMW
jgi:radical SAM protein with 4Fe4S-binding SPASM domain